MIFHSCVKHRLLIFPLTLILLWRDSITKNEEIRKKIQSSIYKFLSRIDVLEPLAEEFRDNVQDYLEEAALESEESI